MLLDDSLCALQQSTGAPRGRTQAEGGRGLRYRVGGCSSVAAGARGRRAVAAGSGRLTGVGKKRGMSRERVLLPLASAGSGARWGR